MTYPWQLPEIESCSSERASCSYDRPGLYSQSPTMRCGRDAQWRIGGTPLCWLHARPFLDGRDADIAAALEVEGERREAARLLRIENGRAGLIYVMQPYGESPAPLKIGFTRDVESLAERVMSVQTGNWRKLEVVCLRQATFPAEQDLHRRLRERWIRGEWFRPHPDVMRAVHAVGTALEMAA